jgi:uncharacterized protein (TIGR00290 family)
MPDPEPVLMSWSGGKDSSLALHAALRDPSLRVVGLLTSVTDSTQRISMHGVRIELLQQQAESIGLPLVLARIPDKATNVQYEAAMESALRPYLQSGLKRCIFGDLFLEDIRKYREEKLARAGMSAIFPLWLKDTRKLALEFIESGFRTILVSVDPKQIDPTFCGREFDATLLAELPSSCDPCGENGEFHTFVYDGPIFSRKISMTRGAVSERDGFWYCELAGS